MLPPACSAWISCIAPKNTEPANIAITESGGSTNPSPNASGENGERFLERIRTISKITPTPPPSPNSAPNSPATNPVAANPM